jgi:hypothetical protein
MRCSAPLFNRATSNPAHAPGWHDRASGLYSGLETLISSPVRGTAAMQEANFVADSLLEGSGFEPSVPLPRLSSIRAVRAEVIGRGTDVFRRDGEFDASALQGRLSTSSQSQCSTDPGLIAGTWHRPLFPTRDRARVAREVGLGPRQDSCAQRRHHIFGHCQVEAFWSEYGGRGLSSGRVGRAAPLRRRF